MRREAPILGAFVLALSLAGCELPEWLGEADGPPLPGDRIAVLHLQSDLEPDAGIADLDIRLPPPWRNPIWPQSGGFSHNANQHLALGELLAPRWQIDIGASADDESRLLAPPVVSERYVFMMDAETQLAAFDRDTGALAWRVDLRPEFEETGALGGGLAHDGIAVYATTGYGILYAIDIDNGELFWRQDLGIPLRAAPTVSGGRVFALTYDNQTHAFSALDGELLWTHAGVPEDAGVIGAAAPAVDGDVVVVPYSSGELFALRVDNGRPLWSDQLVRLQRSANIAAFSDIRGRPVIDRGQVLAVSHSGRLAAVDLRSGNRLWERSIAGVETPWVAGDFIYLLTLQNELVCLTRRDGRIRWVKALPQFEDPEDRDDPIYWYGPVLAGDRLIVVGSSAEALSYSPYDGTFLGSIELPAPAPLAAVVADATLYILTEDADLLALN